jgi:hypothetical protein
LLSKDLEGIGENAFSECAALKTITLPDGLKKIEGSTFYGCESLTGIAIPNIVTSLGVFTFLNCYNLSSLTLSSGLTSISDFAFTSCKALATIVIPEGVKQIGTSAFFDCAATHVTIAASVEYIETNAFDEGGSIYDPAEAGSRRCTDTITRQPRNLRTSIIISLFLSALY